MTRYRIVDTLQFWLAHLVVVPTAFLAAFFGPMLYELLTERRGEIEWNAVTLFMGLGYAIGGYVLGAMATALQVFGLALWQRVRGGGFGILSVIVATVVVCGGLLLLAGLPAIASGKGAVLLPGGRDFGVTVVFAITALAFVATFLLCPPLKLVERADG